MGKGSGVELGKGGKGAKPNNLAEGEGCWNRVGEVEDTGRWEDGWVDGNEGSKSGHLCPSRLGKGSCTGRGEAGRREDGWGDGDNLGRSSQVGGTGGGDVVQREDRWGDGDEVGGVEQSPEMNDEEGSAKFVSIIDVAEVGETRTRKHFPQT